MSAWLGVWRAWLVAWALPLACAAAEATPVIARSAAGRFEVAAVDASLGHAVAAQAEEGWQLLAGPLGLPAEGFVTPVFVRLMSGGPTVGVEVEAGGIVSVRVRAEGLTVETVRRAITRGLLSRLVVARHGVTVDARVPRWLEEGCLGWWRTRAEAAQLDAAKWTSARLSPPALGDLLTWQHGPSESPGFELAALWLFSFLQAESRGGDEWPALLRAMLAGEEADVALTVFFAGRFASEEERELWWQTGWHQVSRARTLPGLEAAESRAQLGALARFVFARAEGEEDVVVPLREVLARAREPVVAAELTRREAEAGRLAPVLHPFYRNAGLSLGEALAAGRVAKPERREAAVAAFERDWRDAVELEAETTAALDALEAAGRQTANRR